MKNKIMILFLGMQLLSFSLYAQTQEDSTQNKFERNISLLYTLHFSDTEGKFFYSYQPTFDLKFRMTNYSDKLDNMSLTAIIGLQELYGYIHFGPEVRFLNHFFATTTAGLYVGLIGFGLLGESELGAKIYFSESVCLEVIGTYQLFLDDRKKSDSFLMIKGGLMIEL